MSKKMVLRVDVHDEKEKQKAMKAVSSLSGVDSLAMDMKDKKLTLIGDVDPVEVVSKLKKNWHTKILTVGPPKEPEKEDNDKDKDKDKCPELRKLYCSQYYPYYGPYYCGADEKPYFCWYS